MFVTATLLLHLIASSPECHNESLQLQSLLGSQALAGAEIGLIVVRLSDGRVLFDHNGDLSLVPASNIKLVSTAAAFDTLGPNYRFATRLFGAHEPATGRVIGDLTLWGNGDPWLIPERLWFLANRLYYNGIREITGDVVVDDSYFTGSKYPDGHQQDESSNAYMAPRGAVSVAFNTLHIHVYPGSTARAPGKVLIEPRSDYPLLDNRTRTTTRGRTRLTVEVAPRGHRSIVKVSGTINLHDGGRGYYRRVDFPAAFAGAVLKKTLEEIGIKVHGLVRMGTVQKDAKRLAHLASLRLSDMVTRINKYSNNFMAEQVALAAGAEMYGAPATWDKAKKVIEAFVEKKIGWEPLSYTIGNASGLHDVNRVSPRQLVALLRWMHRNPKIAPEFITSMAVAGRSGTLASRMQQGAAMGLLRAKTGTLSIASALSGYAHAADGEALGFSMLVNSYGTSIDKIWATQDEIGQTLATLNTRCSQHDPVAQISDPIAP